MIKYLFVIFYFRVVIVFEGGTRQLETMPLPGMSDQPN